MCNSILSLYHSNYSEDFYSENSINGFWLQLAIYKQCALDTLKKKQTDSRRNDGQRMEALAARQQAGSQVPVHRIVP